MQGCLSNKWLIFLLFIDCVCTVAFPALTVSIGRYMEPFGIKSEHIGTENKISIENPLNDAPQTVRFHVVFKCLSQQIDIHVG